MDIRYSANQKDFKRYTTQEVRDEFLIKELFRADEVVAVYSHVDRMLTIGIMPVSGPVALDKGIDVWQSFGSDYLLENREIGIFNLGKPGSISVDGEVYKLEYNDCLYIGKGAKDVKFSSDDGSKNPAKFFMTSCPAHKTYPTKLITIKSAANKPVGEAKTANKRVIYQFIHPSVLETCQLLMGVTALDEGCVWNTMPSHTHERRMEVYFYYEIPEDQAVFHMMGEGSETRHVIMQSEQAIISPSWSIHSGCGTTNYSFIWAMCGENKVFDDMDTIKPSDLR